MKCRSVKPLITVALVVLASLTSLGFQGMRRPPAKPQPLTTEIPNYPSIARLACIQGSVAILVNVDSTGKVTATDTLYGHPLLTPSAEKAAHAWTFDASTDDLRARREVLRFMFHILPFETPEKKLKPVWFSNTDVEIKSHPAEPSCEDCDEKRRLQLRHGGCPEPGERLGPRD